MGRPGELTGQTFPWSCGRQSGLAGEGTQAGSRRVCHSLLQGRAPTDHREIVSWGGTPDLILLMTPMGPAACPRSHMCTCFSVDQKVPGSQPWAKQTEGARLKGAAWVGSKEFSRPVPESPS